MVKMRSSGRGLIIESPDKQEIVGSQRRDWREGLRYRKRTPAMGQGTPVALRAGEGHRTEGLIPRYLHLRLPVDFCPVNHDLCAISLHRKMIHIEYTEIPSYKFSHLKGTCPLTHSPKLIFTKACHVRALSEAAVRQAPASGFLSLECLWTSFLTCKNSPLTFPNSLPSPQEMCPWFQHSPSKK